MDVLTLENLYIIIHDAKTSLEWQDFSNPSITKAINYLNSPTHKVNMSYANAWGFNSDLLQESKIRTPEILSEISRAEGDIRYNLDKARGIMETKKDLLKKGITPYESKVNPINLIRRLPES